MKKPDITKGEWMDVEIDNEVNGALYSTTIGVFMDGRVITIGSANTGQYLSELKANAKAISAVPEMIDALIAYVNLDKEVREGIREDSRRADEIEQDYEEAFQNAKQALKKAGCHER